MKNYKRKNYNELTMLYLIQSWLIHKKEPLYNLIELSEKYNCTDLVFSLLERFKFLNNEGYQFLLNEISDYLIEEISDFKTVQLIALAYDSETDSSQRILYDLCNTLSIKGIRDINSVNQFGKAVSYFKKGFNTLVFIDEFIGSGRTLTIRNNWITKNLEISTPPKYIYLSGLKSTIKKFNKLDLFCPLQMDKGITEYFTGKKKYIQVNKMKELESNLAPIINEKKLSDYTFGYGEAEALYTLEGCSGNTPNNVFPIFWWPKDTENRDRSKLLTRRESGF